MEVTVGSCVQKVKDLLDQGLNKSLYSSNTLPNGLDIDMYNLSFTICKNISTDAYDYIELTGDGISCNAPDPSIDEKEEAALEELFCTLTDLWLLKRKKMTLTPEHKRYIYMRALGGVIFAAGFSKVSYRISMNEGLSTSLYSRTSEVQTINPMSYGFFHKENLIALSQVAEKRELLWPTLIK